MEMSFNMGDNMLLGFDSLVLYIHIYLNVFLKIYLFLAALGLCCIGWTLSSCSEWGLSFVVGMAFSLQWFLLL